MDAAEAGVKKAGAPGLEAVPGGVKKVGGRGRMPAGPGGRGTVPPLGCLAHRMDDY